MKILMAEFSDIKYDSRILKQVDTLSNNGYEITLVMFNSDLSKIKIEKNKNVKKIHLPFKKKYFTDSKLKRFLRVFSVLNLLVKYFYYIIIDDKFSYYHAHNFFIGWIMYIGSFIHKGKFIYDFHELVWAEDKIIFKLGSQIEKFISKKTNIHFCPSDLRSKILKDYYKLKVNPLVIPNYPNKKLDMLDRNTLRTELKIKDDVIILFYSGMLSVNDRKQDKIIKAMQYLKYDCVFVIIGFGHNNEIEYLTKLTEELKLSDKVFILPPKPNSELLKYTTGADIGCCLLDQSKIFNRYHSLNKFYEYCAAGLAILASNSEQFEIDLNHNGVGSIGVTTNENDPYDIAEKINILCSDRDKLSLMKKKSRILHLTKWNWGEHEKTLLEAYFSHNNKN